VLLAVGVLALLAAGGAVAGKYLRANSHLRAARQALEGNDIPAAREHLAECLKVWPARADVRFLAARAARRAGALDEAEQHLIACENSPAVSADDLRLENSMLDAQRGKLTGAVEGYLRGQLDHKHPDTPLILEALAQGYVEQLRLPEALDCLDRCLKQQPDNVPALLWRGRVRERLTKTPDAVLDFRRAVELAHAHEEARLLLADALYLSGLWDEALRHYEQLRPSRPDDPAVLLGLAGCWANTGRLEEAQRLLDRLIADCPPNAVALMERGRLDLENERPAEAERWLRKSLAVNPSDRRTNHLLTQCLRLQGKDKEAREQEQKAERTLADLRRLGLILTEEMSKSPNDPNLHWELGVLCLRNGQVKQGLGWLSRALELDPRHKASHRALADYFTKAGDSARAAHHLRLAQ
jgi:tetratricopeptide (TPR) repeat protein